MAKIALQRFLAKCFSSKPGIGFNPASSVLPA